MYMQIIIYGVLEVYVRYALGTIHINSDSPRFVCE